MPAPKSLRTLHNCGGNTLAKMFWETWQEAWKIIKGELKKKNKIENEMHEQDDEVKKRKTQQVSLFVSLSESLFC